MDASEVKLQSKALVPAVVIAVFLGAFVPEMSAGAAAFPSASVSDATVTEGNSGTTPAVFTVSLSQTSASTVTIDYETSDFTATTPEDYQSIAGTLTFAPGETTKTVTVFVNGDTVDEPNETFNLTLTQINGGTFSDGNAVGTILDDDATPSISINDISTSEGSSGSTTMNITLTLSSSSGSFVSVDYALVDGTATTNDSDYQGGGGNVVFQPGQTTQTIPVTVFGDTNPEADEFFFVNLANPSNATLADSQGRVTVVNDDGPLPTGSPSPSGTASPTPTGTPAVSISDASVVEGNSGTSTVPLTVALSQASSMNVTVDYASHDGSATFNGADYYSQGGTLAFAPGETSKTIVATVVGDTNPEPNETFSIVLSSPNGAVIGKGTGTVTIVDDDAKAPTSTTLAIVKKPSRLKIKGTLDPPDGGEPMVVKLYERANGAFALIGLHRPMLSGATDADGNGTMESLYSTSFHRPSGGTCKVKVHFAGDASHGPSGNSATFRC